MEIIEQDKMVRKELFDFSTIFNILRKKKTRQIRWLKSEILEDTVLIKFKIGALIKVHKVVPFNANFNLNKESVFDTYHLK